jgi:hypothetical protein
MSEVNQRIIKTLRIMAWQRAKGELESVLHSFCVEDEDSDKYIRLKEYIYLFIKNIENYGWVD